MNKAGKELEPFRQYFSRQSALVDAFGRTGDPAEQKSIVDEIYRNSAARRIALKRRRRTISVLDVTR